MVGTKRIQMVLALLASLLATAGAFGNSIYGTIQYLEFGPKATSDLRKALASSDSIASFAEKNAREATLLSLMAFNTQDRSAFSRSYRDEKAEATYEATIQFGRLLSRKISAEIRWASNETITRKVPLGNDGKQFSVSQSSIPSGLEVKTDLLVGSPNVVDVLMADDKARILLITIEDLGPSAADMEEKEHKEAAKKQEEAAPKVKNPE